MTDYQQPSFHPGSSGPANSHRYMTPPFSPVHDHKALDPDQELVSSAEGTFKGTTSSAGLSYDPSKGDLVGDLPTHDPRLTGLGFTMDQQEGGVSQEQDIDGEEEDEVDEEDRVQPNEDEDTVKISQPAARLTPPPVAVAPLSPPAESQPQFQRENDGERTPTKKAPTAASARPTHKPQARSDTDWMRSTVTPDLGQSQGHPHYPAPIAPPQPTHRKRATYNPTMAQSSSSSALVSHHRHHSSMMGGPPMSAEYVLHPAIEAYRQAHPRRGIIYFGPYILLQTLGEGEFGKVKLGVHRDYGEEVAVKLIRRGSVNDQARLSKVEREIEVLKTVKHPNIVRLFDVIETEKYIGIILDFANGGELFDHILAHRYLKEKDAAKLFAQLISGVHYLHQKKIVHRDLKLENLLLDKHRNVIITDFGFANRFEHKKDDLMATSCGSPCYAAPELVISEGLYVGSAVDIWSCGVILYAMLSGYLPFDDDPANPDGDNINLLYRYIVNTPLTFPDYISVEARDLLSKMLVPDPERRCDLPTVMSHPWLQIYSPLFERSVTELEAIAQEQQNIKRSASRRAMQTRMEMYEERRIQDLAKQADMLPSSRPTANQARHKSALPTMSTVPSHLHAAGGASLPPSALIPSSAPSHRTQQALLASHETAQQSRPQIAEAAIPQQAPSDLSRARVEPMQLTGIQSLPPTPLFQPQPPIPDSTTASGLAPATKPPASANKNRHTVQLEYDGDTGYSTPMVMHPNLEAALAQATTEAPQFHPQPQLHREQESSGDIEMVEQLAESEDDKEESTGPAPMPTYPSQIPSSSSERMQLDEDQTRSDQASQSTPIAEAFSQSEASELPLPKTSNTLSAIAPSTIESSKEENGKRNISATSIASGDRQDAKRVAPKPPIENLLPPVASSRHRKSRGLSMDRFGLAKLLSGSNSSTDSVTAKSASALKRSESARIKDNQKAADKKKTGEKESWRKSFQASNKENNPEQIRQVASPSPVLVQAPTPRVPSGGSRTSKGPRPPSVIIQSDRILSPRPTDRSPINPSISTFEAYSTPTPRTGSSSNASSSKAKKVMDWFRRKSLAKSPGIPPIQMQASRADETHNGFPGGAGVVVPSSATLRVEASAASTNSCEIYPENVTAPTVLVTEAKTSDDLEHRISETEFKSGLGPVATEPLAPADQSVPRPASALDQTVVMPPPPPTVKRNQTQPLAAAAPSGPRQPPSRQPSTGRSASSTSLNPAESRLRVHNGVVDQNALTAKPIAFIMKDLDRVLFEMGIETRRESEFKLRCTRARRKKAAATTSMGMSSVISGGSLASLSLSNSAQTSGVDRRGLPVPNSPSGLLSAGSGLRGILMRRGSSQSGINAMLSSPEMGSQASQSSKEGTTQPDPIYGDHSIDSGDEIRFSVELTRLKNLPGLYSLDIKRLRGNIWAYKFVYETVIKRLDLSH